MDSCSNANRRTLLFLAQEDQIRFARELGEYGKCRDLIEQDKPAYDYQLQSHFYVPRSFQLLDRFDGVVFVGPQTSHIRPEKAVFREHTDYIKFLNEKDRRKLPLAAVLECPYRLPDNDRRVECMIKPVPGTHKGRNLPKEIRDQLFAFFDEALREREMSG